MIYLIHDRGQIKARLNNKMSNSGAIKQLLAAKQVIEKIERTRILPEHESDILKNAIDMAVNELLLMINAQ